ncbi:Fe-S-containing protein [Microvirga sp. W0021]|uniref:Fe-S-containing protein n=1 Tax=Hohaiivirga grylli TaxID=3133970 RepID=A0ABV0BJL6_9HYPH
MLSYFWASILSIFLPVTLLLASHWSGRPVYSFWFYILSSLGALLAGITFALLTPQTQSFVFSITAINTAVLIIFMLWQFTHVRDFFWHIILIFLAGLQWGKTPALMAISSTHVINTDLLLNLGNLIIVFAACMVLGWLIYNTLKLLPKWRWPLLIITWLLVLIPLSGKFLLSLMKLQLIELTKIRLSYAAKSTFFENQITYAVLFLTALLIITALVTVVRSRKTVWKNTSELIEKRIAFASYKQALTPQLAGLCILLVMLAGQGYWDAVASQPPQLSEAKRVEMAEGKIRLQMPPLMDGKLHRFAWVADDGKVVRFFVINRLNERVSPAVVFDACTLCGDKGYIQRGDQVVCIACDVSLFKPTIGKAGGCNPVPMEGWTVEGDDIIIPKSTLEAGLPLFNTILTIDVTDPVTGQKLTNSSAPHRYTYAGKTYFFANEQALDAFRDDPDKYIKGIAQ